MQATDIDAEEIDRVRGIAWIADESASVPIRWGVGDNRCEILEAALIQLDCVSLLEIGDRVRAKVVAELSRVEVATGSSLVHEIAEADPIRTQVPYAVPLV